MNSNRVLEKSFFFEARKRVRWAESYIPELEKNPANTEVLSTLSDIFHPIMGLAQFLDMMEIGRIAFHIEKFLKEIKQKNRSLLTHDIAMLKKLFSAFSDSIAIRVNMAVNN